MTLIFPALAEQNAFNELAINELNELSAFYQNNKSAPALSIYNESKELSIEYPFYSYTLALKCRKAILQKNTNDLAAVMGVTTIIGNLTKEVQVGLNELQNEKSSIEQNNRGFESEEWLSLADRELNESEKYLGASQKSYSIGNYNETLIYLTKSDFALYKAEKLLNIAKNRNNTSSMKYDLRSNKDGEEIASNWMKNASDKISLLAKSGNRKDIHKLSINAINESKQYSSDENYYLSVMSVAEGEALAEFGLGYKKYSNHMEALSKSEKQVEEVNNSLKEIYKNYEIDIPLANLHLEMAKIHLNEAKNTKEINIIPLADMAIREALIAKKQIKAATDLKKAIEYPVDASRSPVSMQAPLGTMPLLGAIIAVCVLRRRQEKR